MIGWKREREKRGKKEKKKRKGKGKENGINLAWNKGTEILIVNGSNIEIGKRKREMRKREKERNLYD